MRYKSVLALIPIIMLSSVLTACNTTRGVGEDIEAGGKAIQRTAQ